jgi:hypothetical protein
MWATVWHPTRHTSNFFSRAWRLCMDKDALRNHPNLQQVQVEGLSAFYLLTCGQVNRCALLFLLRLFCCCLFVVLSSVPRSWRTCGAAIGSALAMGLNIKNESPISALSKEIRCRMWWALFNLDTLLSTITGRPSRVPQDFCTTRLPSPCDESAFMSQSVNDADGDRRTLSTVISRLVAHIPAVGL